MNVTVFQPGARHNYAIARMLDKAGMLQRFYSDQVFRPHGVIEHLLPLLPQGRLRKGLSRRVPRGVSSDRIISNYRGLLDPKFIGDVRSGRFANQRDVTWKILPKDKAATDIIFTTYFAGGPTRPQFRPDAKLVSDIIIVPSVYKIGNAEVARFPEWDEAAVADDFIAEHDDFVVSMLKESDALFCPAEAVIDDVARYGEQFRQKCQLVPYGASLSFDMIGTPVPKRCLFAGAVHLRKGPQYLKQAAERLLREDRDIEIVIAGAISDAARNQLALPNITVLGQLSREEMHREFSRADLFVFPSLAEGSAGVVLEAMAASLPIVATKAAGVDIPPEAGIIVQERDPDAIAAAVLSICHDRDLRAAMSAAARARAARFSEAHWQGWLIAALQSVQQDH